ncbi:zinc-binding dehydrogenase [Streptomyces lasalocidi]
MTATTTDADTDVLRELGAAEIIGYQQADYPAGIDVAVDAALPGDRLTGLAAALRPRGRLLTITCPVPAPELIGRDDVGMHFVLDMDGDLGGTREVGDAAVRGELRATIGHRYRLDRGPQAALTSSACTPRASSSSRGNRACRHEGRPIGASRPRAGEAPMGEPSTSCQNLQGPRA